MNGWRFLGLRSCLPCLAAVLCASPLRAGETPPVERTPDTQAAQVENEWTRKLEAIRKKLRGGEVIFQDAFERKELGDEWAAEEGDWQAGKAAAKESSGVTGAPGSKYPDSFLWTKRSFQGDLAVEFDAQCLSAPAHDINFVICGKTPNYPPPEKPLYLFGLGGWGNTQSGVERAPDYKWKALSGLFTIEKDRKYHVLAGRLGSKFYLFADERLVLMASDPEPLPAEGQFAFHVYKSTVRFENLVIRKPGK